MGKAAALAAALAALCACGTKTGLLVRDDAGADLSVPARDLGTDLPPPRDLGPDVPPPPVDLGPDAPDLGCIPASDGCGARVEVCGNGADDDCNGLADDGCPCEPGRVQRCFAGPPGRRNVGICTDGLQTCTAARTWGVCTGGILPMPDVCNGTDNLCDGCSARRDCPISCPSPGDVRVPDGMPFVPYVITGASFYPGMAAAWSWRVVGGPCDALSSVTSFTLDGASSPVATLTPRLSGDYTVTMTVTTVEGSVLTCTWVVHVRGPGLRVEMCYPESTTQDLDLYLHRSMDTSAWFTPSSPLVTPTPNDAQNPEVCGWHDCEATIRGTVGRASWGYADTDVSQCQDGPHGMEWLALGHCSNPRLDVDNNLSEGTGLPENINLDDPHDGDRFRIMVQNYTGMTAHPVVNVYCGGARVATFGAAPDTLTGYMGETGATSVGAMWRVADVTVHVDPSGTTTGCDVVQLHAPFSGGTGYYVSMNDPVY